MTGNFVFPRNAFLGFDHIFDALQDIHVHANDGYPPHNVVRDGEQKYIIEMAVAGFNKKDIEVLSEHNQLTVRSKKGEADQTDDSGNVIHRGISKRQFVRSFTVADNVEVRGAELKDGLLVIALERIIPEEHKEKFIEIK